MSWWHIYNQNFFFTFRFNKMLKFITKFMQECSVFFVEIRCFHFAILKEILSCIPDFLFIFMFKQFFQQCNIFFFIIHLQFLILLLILQFFHPVHHLSGMKQYSMNLQQIHPFYLSTYQVFYSSTKRFVLWYQEQLLL